MKHAGFTLLELMIVIIIIGATTIITFKNPTILFNKPTFEILNIYKNLSELKKESNTDITLTCFKNCTKCMINENNVLIKEINPIINQDCKVYEYTYEKKVILSSFMNFKFEDIYHQTCLSITVDKNNGIKEYIIECKNKTYILGNNFNNGKTFKNLNEAIEFKDKIYNFNQ